MLVWSVFKRELRQYFQSPGTYVALTFFFLLSGALFTLIVGDYVDLSLKARAGALQGEDHATLNVTQQVITPLFQALNFIMVILIPMLTMRLVAEEKKNGSFELLVSTPLSNWDILLGKYFAAVAVGLTILAVCIAYPIITSIYSAPEFWVIVSCYVGLFLIILAYTSLGVFTSSLAEGQIAAGVLAFVGLMFFQMIGWLFKTGALGRIATDLSVNAHSDNFTKGVIALDDITFFLLFSCFWLFLAAQILDARRWRA